MNILNTTLVSTRTSRKPLLAVHIPPDRYAGVPAAVSEHPQVEFYEPDPNGSTLFGNWTGTRLYVEDVLAGGPVKVGRTSLRPDSAERLRAWLVRIHADVRCPKSGRYGCEGTTC